MKKVSTWILNHLVIVLAVLVFVPTIIISACIIVKSYNVYQAYEAVYNENDLEVRSLFDAQPTNIVIQDKFVSYKADGTVRSSKSSYKNNLTAYPEDFTVTTEQTEYVTEDGFLDLSEKGGKVVLKFTLPERSFMDIVFNVSSQNTYIEDGKEKYGVKDLLGSVNFVINGQTMEEEVTLTNKSADSPEWHNLVMRGFALPEGNVTVEIKSLTNKVALMPQIRSITFFTSAVLSYAQ